MDYGILLELAADLGFELAMCGAETFRIEESVGRVLQAYGVRSEVFAIPNSLTVSIETEDGQPMTCLRRIGIHGNDLDSVEQFSGLSRRLCQETPPPEEAVRWLEQVRSSRRSYSMVISLLGHFLGAYGFSLVFGGSIMDGLCGGLCGLVIGIINRFTGKLKANQFFSIIAASFPMMDNMGMQLLYLNQTLVKDSNSLTKSLVGLFQKNIFQQFKKVSKMHYQMVT